MNYAALWSPVKVGDLEIRNRIAMAPMTRNRSTPTGVPNALNAQYYGQRASNGLIISEGTQPSAIGQGYLLTPGIHTDEQIAGWRETVDAVHEGGGRIFIQLMHVGRVGHPDNTPHGSQPVAPSAVRPGKSMVTPSGMVEIPEPRELTEEEIRQTVRDFAAAARAAIDAGADGIEIHGGYGYLVHQFLAPNTNLRVDGYGGSIPNRVRFAVEVVAAIAAEIGAHRIGIRLSPGNALNGIDEPDPREAYLELVRQLAALDIAYIHYVLAGNEELLREIREIWPKALIVNRAGADLAHRARDVEEGLADLIAVGSLALANPDLAHRLQQGAELNEPDSETFYGGDHVGYTDYPHLSA